MDFNATVSYARKIGKRCCRLPRTKAKTDPGGTGDTCPPPLASLTVGQWGVKVNSLFFPRLDTSHHEANDCKL